MSNCSPDAFALAGRGASPMNVVAVIQHTSGEYLGLMLICCMIATLFFGGWLGPVLPPLLWFLIKVFILICFFILLRAAIPRPRYDQLMSLGWKYMLPLTLVNLVVTGAVALSMRGA